MKALEIRVIGIVQGVFFRASTRDQAIQLGISGWCQNEPDGSVFIYAEGTEEALIDLVAWCHQGPMNAEVTNVESKEVEAERITGFSIRR